jgi:hypothetical protein
VNSAKFAELGVFWSSSEKVSQITHFRDVPHVFSMAPCEPGEPNKTHEMRVENGNLEIKT